MCGPTSFSTSLAIRGPTPDNVVTGEKIGNKISGRILKYYSQMVADRSLTKV
jgi:hypothetical protein